VDLDHARLPLHSDEKSNFSKFIFILLLPMCSYLKILVRQWGYGAKIDPVLVFDAKGGENKGQSDKWISYHLRDFENSRIELLVCVKTRLMSLLSKVGFLWGEVLIMGKREKGEFLKS
jgi:hypothetical protein